MRNRILTVIVAMLVFFSVGCGDNVEPEHNPQHTKDVPEINIVSEEEPKVLHFVDAHGESYEVEIDSQVRKKAYENDSFVCQGDRMSYVGKDYTYRLGIDVSHYQADIDWEKVKNSGIEFVIIRLGSRGYGEDGVMKLDTKFEDNIQGARAAGLDVGVYFFSQAINEEEAIEEAEFVQDHLAGYELQLPVVYDPETILHDEARTDDVTGEQFTKNTIAFCEAIESFGYDAMVYCNMLWQAYELDLTALEDYPIWYADYEPHPQTPYHFDFWQYSSEGKVDGIQGNVDLNIQMIKS